MEVQGTIKEIFETNQISEKFKKREVVVTTKEQYPQDIIMQFTQDKCNILDKYNVGEDVEVHVNLRGRGWTKNGATKYFNTLEAWRINKLSEAVGSQTSSSEGEDLDTLPF